MASAKPIRIQVVYRHSDYNEAIWYHASRSPAARGSKLMAGVMLMLGIVTLFSHTSALLSAGLFAVAVFQWFSPPWASLLKSYAARRRSTNYGQEHDIEFSDSGIRVKTPKTDNALPWNRFIGAVESPASFLIYFTRHQFLVIPKRVFASPDQVGSLRKLLLSKVRPRK